MYLNLWTFLSIGAVFGITFITVAILIQYKTNIKKLEIEALQLKKADMQAEVEDTVNKKLGDQLKRIEVLEAIVTEKNYDLNEKIASL